MSLVNLPSMNAGFGPTVPVNGIRGVLVVARPADGCSALDLRDVPENRPWIALMWRSPRTDSGSNATACTFDTKVRNAQSAGAVAAIISDDMDENLLVMSKPAGSPDPGIPSVFVTRTSGQVLRAIYQPGRIELMVTPDMLSLWMGMMVHALSFSLSFSAILLLIHLANRYQLRRRPGTLQLTVVSAQDQGLDPLELKELPIMVHRGHPRPLQDGGEEAGPSHGPAGGADGADDGPSVWEDVPLLPGDKSSSSVAAPDGGKATDGGARMLHFEIDHSKDAADACACQHACGLAPLAESVPRRRSQWPPCPGTRPT